MLWPILRITAGVLLRALISRPVRHWLMERLTYDPLRKDIDELRELVTATYVSAHQVKRQRPDLCRCYGLAYLITHHEGDSQEIAHDLRLTIGEVVRELLTPDASAPMLRTGLCLSKLLRSTESGGRLYCSSEDVRRLTKSLVIIAQSDDLDELAIRSHTITALTAAAEGGQSARQESSEEFLRRVLDTLTTTLHEIVALVTEPTVARDHQAALAPNGLQSRPSNNLSTGRRR